MKITCEELVAAVGPPNFQALILRQVCYRQVRNQIKHFQADEKVSKVNADFGVDQSPVFSDSESFIMVSRFIQWRPERGKIPSVFPHFLSFLYLLIDYWTLLEYNEVNLMRPSPARTSLTGSYYSMLRKVSGER